MARLQLFLTLIAALILIGGCAPAPPPEEPLVGLAGTPEESWLAEFNRYRRAEGLGPIADDPTLSAADLKHAQYVVKNHVNPNYEVHLEERDNQWFTPEGYDAARHSSVVTGEQI